MAIFNKETQFYTHVAPPLEPDQPFLTRFVDFVVEHVFVVNVVVGIFVYAFTAHGRALNGIMMIVGATTTYLLLIAIPAIIAVILASPALLAWKKHKHHLFKRIYEATFVFLYFIIAMVFLASSWMGVTRQ